MTIDESKENWKRKIEALLLKAENPATTAEERETILDRVYVLMAKFGIEEAMLSAAQQRNPEMLVTRYRVTAPYAMQKGRILHAIGRAFGCTVVNASKTMGNYTCVGYEDDQERVFMLYNSLLIQFTVGMAMAYANKPSHIHGKSFNTSFAEGFTFAVCDRIKAAYTNARKEAMREQGSGVEIVLFDRASAVAIRVSEIFPSLRMISHNSRISSGDGYGAGSAAGRSADIGQTRMGGKTVRQLGS